MVPRLPPELLDHILALACEGSPPRERRTTRHSSRRVCWEWYDAACSSNELIVLGADELGRAVSALGRPRACSSSAGEPTAAPKVRALHVGLTCAGLEEVNLQRTRKGLRDSFRLLKEMDGLQKLEVEMGRLVCAGYSGDGLDVLTGPNLEGLRELTLGGPSSQEEPVWCVDELERYVPAPLELGFARLC